MTSATPRALAVALIVLTALLAAGRPAWAQVDVWVQPNAFLEVDADDGSTFSVTPDEDDDGYLEDAGVRCEWIQDGNGQPWVQIPQDTYMGLRAYMVEAEKSHPTARTEVRLMDNWKFMNPPPTPQTLFFSFAFYVRFAPPPSVPSCIILQVHQESGRPPPVVCQIVNGVIRFSTRGQNGREGHEEGTNDYKVHWTSLFDGDLIPDAELAWDDGCDPQSHDCDPQSHARMRLDTHRWYRFLLELDPSVGGDGRARLWWMDDVTGRWELVGDRSNIPIGWLTKQPDQTDHDWKSVLHYKTGIYGSEEEKGKGFDGYALVHLDNISFSNRWTWITKNRTVGYHRAIVALPFNEPAGPYTNDWSSSWNDGWGFNNDGVLHGPPLRALGGVRGAADRCLYFDGEGTDYVRVPTNNDVEFDTGNYLTLSAWLRTDYSQEDAGLLTIGEFSDSYKARLYYSDDRTVEFSVRHPGDTVLYPLYPYGHRNHVVAENLPALNDGDWHHVTGTYNRFAADGRRLKLYLDGTLVASAEGQDLPITRGPDNINMYVAKMSGQYFTGYMDEVMVFNYAMTPDDVKWHHACYLSRNCWFVREAPNHKPLANAGGDQLVKLRQARTMKLDGSGSSDPDGDSLRYRWRQTAGPPVQLYRARSRTAVVQVDVPDEETVLEFSLTVDDRHKTSDPDTVRVRLRPAVSRPLQACFSTSPFPTLRTPIEFDAGCTQAHSRGASVSSWRWDFGDGGAASSEPATHSYAVAGTYTVTLTVTDDRGNTHTLRRPVEVAPDLPFRDDFEWAPGPVSGWTPSQGSWDITDSQELAVTTEGAEAWTWAGSPPAVMSGNTTVEFDTEFQSTPRGPNDRVGRHGGIMLFAAEPTSRGQTSGYTVSWIDREGGRGIVITRFDDGVPTPLSSGTPVLAEPPSRWRIEVAGPLILVYGDGERLAVAKDDTYREGHFGLWAYRGGQDIRFDDFCAVSGLVDDPCVVPLTACFATSHQPASGAPVLFDGRCSGFLSRGSEVTSWRWEFGDGSMASGEVVEHTYESAGTLTVSLTVTDRAGDPATLKQLVQVAPGLPFRDDFD